MMSSYRKRNLHSSKYVEKMRQKRVVMLFIGTFFLVVAGAAFILMLRASFLQIKTVSVDGTTISSGDAISAAALSALSGSYFSILPHSSIFFFSRSKINQAIESNFKDVKDLSIHRNGINSLQVLVHERTPAAVVCAGFRDDQDEPNDCYWSDAEGYVFSHIATSSPFDTSLPHYYIPNDQTAVTLGTSFISQKNFIDLQKFLDGALKGGLLPLGILMSDNGEYEMYVKNPSGDSEITVYFDNRSPLDTTLSNLLTFWQNNSDTKNGTSTPNFDYINLRFGNTVYYSTQ